MVLYLKIAFLFFLIALSVISVRAVLSVIVLILQFLRRRLNAGIDRLRPVCHLRHFFQNDSIVHRIMGIFAPGKRTVVLAQHCRNRHNILAHLLKFAYDQKPSILLISLCDFLFRQAAQAGYFAINIIRMGRPVAGNISSRLRPARRIGRMRMHDAANLRISLIQFQMRRRI